MQERIVYQPSKNSQTEKTMTQSGTLEQWKEKVASLASGHPYLVFSLCLGFAGPLLKPARLDSGGFHIFGGSTQGKTTLLQMAASVWGNGSDPAESPENCFIRRWNNTANSLEGICVAHRDGLLCLDELKTCPVKDFQKIVYDMYGGTGKGVMDQNRELKEVRTWRIIVLSSGELSTFDKSKESGAPINAGQLIRFKDIPIEGKIVENAIDAEAIKYACSQFYGTAGPAFVQALIDEIKDWETMHTTIGEMMKTAIEKMPKTADALQARGLKHFALAKVAGVLAKRYLDLPLTEDEITNSVSKIAKIWMDNSGSLSDTDRAIIKLRNLIQTDGESRFRRLPGDERAQIINQAGWWDLNKKIVYINEATFTDEICAGLSYREVANALCEKGLLNRSGTHLQTELGATIKCWAERDESAKKSPSINRIKKVRAFSINDSIVNYGIEGST